MDAMHVWRHVPRMAPCFRAFPKTICHPWPFKPPCALILLGQNCRACQDICPENAIDLNQDKATHSIGADAVVIAAGFQPFVPTSKPYGYGHFSNVITNLELERMLRQHSQALMPSDRTPARKIAFIQCVGSRDAKLNHLWCSKVCCGSASANGALDQSPRPASDITWFYIDVQTFGKDFQSFYEAEPKRASNGPYYTRRYCFSWG